MKKPYAIPALWKRLTAEAIGTFFLVAAGCGAIIVETQSGRLGHVGVSLAFGLVIAAMVAATGHISGAHLNPAVTLAFTSIRSFPWQEVPAYIAAQLVGASAGAAVLLGIFGDVAVESSVALGSTVPAGSATQSLWLEALLTSCLMFSITAVATDARAPGPIAAIVIGSAVALGALWGGPISGASMNPARSFGPALLSGTWQDHWLYWLGPIVGAVAAASAYRALQDNSK